MAVPTTEIEESPIVPSPEETPAAPTPARRIEPQKVELNGGWRFRVDPRDEGEGQGWYGRTYPGTDWIQVTVPHTWGVMPEYADYDGYAWYRRTFVLPAKLEGAHVRLRFDATFYLSKVWLNGIYLGSHEGGYTPYEFDITEAVDFDAENVLAVKLDNRRERERLPAALSSQWSFDWWNYGGIVRDVYLLISNPVFIARQRIFAQPDLVDKADITVGVTIRNASDADQTVLVKAAIADERTGAAVWTAEDALGLQTRLTVPAHSTRETELTTTLPNPRLWHFDHPELYRLVTGLSDEAGNPLHRAGESFGIRKIEIKNARLYLNGEWVRLVGLTRHADSPAHGLAETTTIMAADYDDLKRLNTVLSRPVHYPQHEFILDYCDRHGILLIPEVPAWQLDRVQMASKAMGELARQQLREMIEQGFNHPSVWAWSLGNEIESKTVEGHEFVKEMVAYIKSLDPTRPVGFASNRLNDAPQFDATVHTDFVMMNQYFGTWVGPKRGLGPALDHIHETWPDRLVIISEYGFEPRWNRLWGPPTASLNRQEYYYLTDEELDDPLAAARERQKLIREQLAIMRPRDFVGGAIFWCYQDYRTPSGFKMGVVNAQREPSGAYHVLKEEYSPALLEAVSHEPDTFVAGEAVTTQVVVRSRGPVEREMPAYTLRDYTLRWQVLSRGGDTLQEGMLSVPVLAPGESWEGSFAWTVPADPAFDLRLSVVRPTGFACLEKVITAGSKRAATGP